MTTTTTTTALVTGANKGLGFETARQLAGRGWTVFLGARDHERGRVAAEKLVADGGDVRFVPLDVTDDASVAAAVDDVAGQVDHLDVLVNNAGIIGSRTPPLDTGPGRLPRLLRREPARPRAGDAGVPGPAAGRRGAPRRQRVERHGVDRP